MVTTRPDPPDSAEPTPRLLCWGWRRGQGGELAAGFLVAGHPDMLDFIDRLGATAVVAYEPPAHVGDLVPAVAEELRAIARFLGHRLGNSAEAGTAAVVRDKVQALMQIALDLENPAAAREAGAERE